MGYLHGWHGWMPEMYPYKDLELAPTDLLNLERRFGELFDWILKRRVKREDYFLYQKAKIFVVDSAHIADPSMGIVLAFFAKGES